MPSVHDWTGPLAGWCLAVPARGPGVCPACRGALRPGFSTCASCACVLSQVALPCRRVVPVSIYRVGGPLHQALRRYKDGPTAAVRRRHAVTTVALLARFVFDHGPCLAGGAPWDLVTTVPSTSGGDGPHPLEAALALVPWLEAQHTRTLARTAVPLHHRSAGDGAFTVTADVGGARVLVVDDTYTSGARAQSAASALALAGARVLAIVPVGRVVDPGWAPHVAAYWRALAAEPFDFGRCCLDGDRQLRSGADRGAAGGQPLSGAAPGATLGTADRRATGP
ncbi:MAG: hypothetical protein ACRD0L_14080 [Acidimicrobiales bacterium]